MWFDRLFDGFSGMSEYDKERAKEREFLKAVIASANSIRADQWQKCPLSSDTHTKYEATTGLLVGLTASSCSNLCPKFGDSTDPLHERPVAVPAELKDPTSCWKLPTRIRVHRYDSRTVGLVQNYGRSSNPLPGSDGHLVSRSCETVRSGSKGSWSSLGSSCLGRRVSSPAPVTKEGARSAKEGSGSIRKASHELFYP